MTKGEIPGHCLKKACNQILFYLVILFVHKEEEEAFYFPFFFNPDVYNVYNNVISGFIAQHILRSVVPGLGKD